MDETTFWKALEEIFEFGEFVVAIPNSAASANIVGKISIGRDGKERVIDKNVCHCHVHLEPEKISEFSFTHIDVGFGKEPCCELNTPQDETILRLYLRGNAELAGKKFGGFSFKERGFVKGKW